MKKRILSMVVAVATLVSLCAGIVPAVKADDALPSYNFSYYYEADNMGVLEHLKHYARDVVNNTYTELEYRESDGTFICATGNYTNGTWFSTGSNPAVETAVFFTAPYSGKITITNAAENGNMVNRGFGWGGNQGTAYARIWDNENQQIAYYDIPASDTPVPTPAIEDICVEAGDQIKFIVGSTTGKNDYIQWIPVITYTSIDKEPEMPSYNFSYYYEADNMGVLEHLKHYARDVASNTYTELGYRESDGLFLGGEGNYTNGTWFSTGSNPAIETAVFFTAPYSGRITITNAAENGNMVNRGAGWGGNQGTAYARIWDNENQQIAYYDIPASDTPVPTPAIENIYVEAGDQIKFTVGSTTGKNDYIQWIPVITYTSIGKEVVLPSYNFSYYYEADNMGVLEHLKHYARDAASNTYTELSYRESDGMFLGGEGNYTNGGWLSTGSNPAIETAVFFIAPYSGKITVTNAAEDGNIVNRGAGWGGSKSTAYAKIWDNAYQQIAYYDIPASETPVPTPAIEDIYVEAGDEIKFIVGSTTGNNDYIQWVPVVTYTEIHEHTWQTSWQTNETHHWHDCTESCELTDITRKDGYGTHEDTNDDALCDVCGYRLYVENAVSVEKCNISLGDNLNMNFYLTALDCYLADTVVTVTAMGEQTAYHANELPKTADGRYVITVELAAAHMTEEINIKAVSGGFEFVNKTYSVRQYAEYILDDANGYSEKDKLMVQAMLHYGASAQLYFKVNTENLANNGYTDTVAEEIPNAAGYNPVVSGSVDGIRFHGASLLLKSKIAVRFYFTVTGDNTYTVNGQPLKEKDGLWYIDVEDIAPQSYAQIIEVTVSNADGESFTVSYSPVHYIARQHQKTEDQALKDLLQNLYDYHKTAVNYVA